MKKIAIIGGGVAGATTAISLGKLGLGVTLFEKEKSLVGGPPFCHLHAGGNLYREISDTQCIKLLKQSIDFAKFYPFVVDYRPTVIVLPKVDKSSLNMLLDRLGIIKNEYQKLVNKDPSNGVLGEVENYYKIYSKDDLYRLKELEIKDNPKTQDDWIIPVAKNLDFNMVQFPIIMVNEFGLNLFRLASSAKLLIDTLDFVDLKLNVEITNIKRDKSGWSVESKDGVEHFDYIINSAGFRTGTVDDMIGIPCKKMVEFKSAYVSYCKEYSNIKFPEIVFHGERGTPNGMGQFTPYSNGHFQLHAMTTDITLYKNGLVSNSPKSCQPKLDKSFITKIEKEWDKDEIEDRTNRAIEHISKFIPKFKDAQVASKPLFGAQQIVGDDPTLRVAEVSFPVPYYARCEIVKVSSVIDMVDRILDDLVELKILDTKPSKIDSNILDKIDNQKIDTKSKELAQTRGYPSSLGELVNGVNL